MASRKVDLLKEKGINLILSSILGLEVVNLTKLEKTILTGFFVDGKSLKDLQDDTQLTKTRVTAILDQGVRRLTGNISHLDTKLRNFDKLAGDLYQAQGLLRKLDGQLKKRGTLTEKQLNVLNLPISETGLSARTINVCDYGNIRKVADLVKTTKTEYLKLRNAGKKGVDEIDSFFIKNGLSWGMDV